MSNESHKKILKINKDYLNKSQELLKQMVNKDLDKDQMSTRKRRILKANKDYLNKVNEVMKKAMLGGGKNKRKRIKRKNTKKIKKKSMKRSKKKKIKRRRKK
jgi:Rps23 Pro-64 3,4-dihydroxylase Tpa1-like proline 4-hydroxylase